MSRRRVSAGAHEVDPPVLVPAGELFEWSFVIGWSADWLTDAAETTRYDFRRHFAAHNLPLDPASLAARLEQVHERIGALLDGDREPA
jgi:hypothetical protein